MEKSSAIHIVFLAALDPAGIPFSKPRLIAEILRLSKGDARTIVAVHSDPQFLGSALEFANFSIFLNDGCQPECLCPPYLDTLAPGRVLGFLLDLYYGLDLATPTVLCRGWIRQAELCFHFTAIRIAIEAIRQGQTQNYITTGPTGQRVPFTLSTIYPAEGRYQLNTRAFYPYN